jgi:hypothetical protein
MVSSFVGSWALLEFALVEVSRERDLTSMVSGPLSHVALQVELQQRLAITPPSRRASAWPSS